MLKVNKRLQKPNTDFFKKSQIPEECRHVVPWQESNQNYLKYQLMIVVHRMSLEEES